MSGGQFTDQRDCGLAHLPSILRACVDRMFVLLLLLSVSFSASRADAKDKEEKNLTW